MLTLDNKLPALPNPPPLGDCLFIGGNRRLHAARQALLHGIANDPKEAAALIIFTVAIFLRELWRDDNEWRFET